MGSLYTIQGKGGRSWGIDYRVDGRRIRRIIGPDRKAAEQELKKAEGQAASGQGPGPYGSRKIRFRDFADEYLEHCAAHVKPSSLKSYRRRLKVLTYAFGDMYLTALRQSDVERYVAARSRAVKPWTVVGEISTLKQMLGTAIRWDYLWKNPAQAVKKPKAKYRTRHLDETEMHLLLAFCSAKIRPIVSLAFHAGMRQGELLDLTWDRVHLDLRTIFLPDTKGDEPQTVHLNDSAVEELRAIARRPGDPRVFRVHPRTLNYQFRDACTKAGIADFRFHDSRHTFCSRLVELGANLRAVQALARHKQISMTMRYAHLRDDYLGETVRLLNSGVDRNPARNSEPSREKG
ncbi:MAG: tyrosine-type recombinase/integrase [Candidatus Methylomirabilales bacterium]